MTTRHTTGGIHSARARELEPASPNADSNGSMKFNYAERYVAANYNMRHAACDSASRTMLRRFAQRGTRKHVHEAPQQCKSARRVP